MTHPKFGRGPSRGCWTIRHRQDPRLCGHGLGCLPGATNSRSTDTCSCWWWCAAREAPTNRVQVDWSRALRFIERLFDRRLRADIDGMRWTLAVFFPARGYQGPHHAAGVGLGTRRPGRDSQPSREHYRCRAAVDCWTTAGLLHLMEARDPCTALAERAGADRRTIQVDRGLSPARVPSYWSRARVGFPSRETRWPVGARDCGTQRLARRRPASIRCPYLGRRFDRGGDAASPVEDRHRDGRFAALEFITRSRSASA